MNSKASIQNKSHWLVTTGLLNINLLEQAKVRAREQGQPLVKYLVDTNQIESAQLATSASLHFRLPLVDLDAIDPTSMPLTAVAPELVRKFRALPLFIESPRLDSEGSGLHKQGSKLLLGISDPAVDCGLNEFSFQTGYKPETLIVEEDKLNLALQDMLDKPAKGPGRQAELAQPDFDALVLDDLDTESEINSPSAVNETPVMRLVNKMLGDAIGKGASDIHIESYEHSSRIRFREDGMLREIARPPQLVARKIGSRLKIMARLDIAEKRLPQDGRFKLKVARSRAMDFRVNTLPTLWGEKTVLRILDPGPEKLDLDTLGFNSNQKQMYIEALHRQQGLILVTGPTGSGKSCSLYAGLHLLNTQERNIATVEDPVEIHLEGINQVAVNTQIGLDFAEALRAFLRQDPDVLMVGEIRDLETAKIAVRAAQTGHLVMSTLHTNNAAETLARLLDMGVSPYHMATSLSLIIAQRLLRRLCDACKKPLQLPPKVLIQEGFSSEILDNVRLFTPVGCGKCHCGYRGRVGIYETVAITDAISRVIINGGNSIQIAELAKKAGFNSLRESALEKAGQGLTSLAEVNRMT